MRTYPQHQMDALLVRQMKNTTYNCLFVVIARLLFRTSFFFPKMFSWSYHTHGIAYIHSILLLLRMVTIR